MKKRKNSLLLLPVLVSLSVGDMQARSHCDGLVAGACAIGAAILGAAGIAAVADWCSSETDDQLIGRVGNQFHTVSVQYQQTMDYFGPRAGVGIHPPHKRIEYISEDVLYEFGTFVWNSATSQADYRSSVWSAKNALKTCINDLQNRIQSLEGKYNAYEDQKRLATMRTLLKNGNQLLADISLFADCLECHKTYFTLYDSVGHIRNRYLQYITVLESGHYSVAAEIKNYVANNNPSQYAFMNFVKNMESDIATLQTNVNALKHTYQAATNYTHYMINQLVSIKNIVSSDVRYQQELYQSEQARLERQRSEAMEARASLERDRMRIERDHNRLREQQIQFEREKMYTQQMRAKSMPYSEEVSVTVTY